MKQTFPLLLLYSSNQTYFSNNVCLHVVDAAAQRLVAGLVSDADRAAWVRCQFGTAGQRTSATRIVNARVVQQYRSTCLSLAVAVGDVGGDAGGVDDVEQRQVLHLP